MIFNQYKSHLDAMLASDEPHFKKQIQYLQDPLRIYNHKYFTRHYEQYRKWEKELGKDLTKHLSIKSLVDFGCGCGSYLEGAKELGSKVQGFELCYDIVKEIVKEDILSFISFGDAMQPIECGTFDCSMSIETAEHILPVYSDNFVNNLCRATEQLCVLTAAPSGQRGTGHINLQAREYWIDKFKDRGFQYLSQETDNTIIRWAKIIPRKAKYLLRNLMIFHK